MKCISCSTFSKTVVFTFLADQMIEPMAAPIGFSVQAAQGTGLGPAAQQLAVTGTQNSDEEIAFQKLNANAIPPPAPGMGGGPVVSATPYNIPGGISTNNLPTTTASVTSPLTHATNMNGNSGGKTVADDSAYQEVDIFVPGVPSAPPGHGEEKDHDDDDDNEKPAASGGGSAAGSGTGTSTYEDLAARFEQLKK